MWGQNQRNGIRGHSFAGSGTRDKPWDRDQSFLRDQAKPFFGVRAKICRAFGIKDQQFGFKNGISDAKTYLVTTPPEPCPRQGVVFVQYEHLKIIDNFKVIVFLQ